MMGSRGGEEIRGVNNNQDFRIEKLVCHHLLSWGKNQSSRFHFLIYWVCNMSDWFGAQKTDLESGRSIWESLTSSIIIFIYKAGINNTCYDKGSL